MKKRDNNDYLTHIADSISRIEKYCEGLDEDKFLESELVQDAVIRQFEIIGEAAKKLDTKLRQTTAHIPWRAIAGTRDILIHQYFGVDLKQVWKFTGQDLSELKSEIKKLLLKK